MNIPYLQREIDDIVSKGVPKPHILVSDRAQILMPYHIDFDAYEEERLGGKHLAQLSQVLLLSIQINMQRLDSRYQNYLMRKHLRKRWQE